MSILPNTTTVKEPNVPEFLKIYAPIFIRIKHPYHHLNRMWIETREVPIDQRLPQLSLRQLAHPCFVDCLEKWKKRCVGAAAAGGCCSRRSRRRWWTPMVSLWWRTKAVILGWGRCCGVLDKLGVVVGVVGGETRRKLRLGVLGWSGKWWRRSALVLIL